MGCMVLAILFNGVCLLNNYWSVAYHQAIAYKSLSGHEIDKCTHVRVIIDNKKQSIVKKFIVPILIKTMDLDGNVIVAYQVEV